LNVDGNTLDGLLEMNGETFPFGKPILWFRVLGDLTGFM